LVSDQSKLGAPSLRPSWRVKIGFVLVVISFGWILVPPIMPLLGFSGTTIAAFSGFMLLIGEPLLVLAAAISGKEGYAYIKSRFFGFLKAHAPPTHVSRTRYRIGLVLFSIPLLLAWVAPYIQHLLPNLDVPELAYAIPGDLMLLVSLFVLGGDFWDKLRALFVYEAQAVTLTDTKKVAPSSTK